MVKFYTRSHCKNCMQHEGLNQNCFNVYLTDLLPSNTEHITGFHTFSASWLIHWKILLLHVVPLADTSATIFTCMCNCHLTQEWAVAVTPENSLNLLLASQLITSDSWSATDFSSVFIWSHLGKYHSAFSVAVPSVCVVWFAFYTLNFCQIYLLQNKHM